MPSESERDGAGAEPSAVERELVRVLEADVGRRDALLHDLAERAPEQARAVRERLSLLEELGLSTEPQRPALAPHAHGPSTYGGYRLVARIGGGGMGEVHLAQDERGERVAVKLLRPDHLVFESARRRFLREISAASRLAHPGIVATLGAGDEDGVPWLAMRYVAGASLAEVIAELAAGAPPEARGGARLRDPLGLTRADFLDALGACARRAGVERPVDPDAFPGASYAALVATLVARVARALEHAHGEGVIHRDVKPSNVLVTPEGEVLLADFGLALPVEAGRLTRTGSWLGSLPYAAPEQLDGRAVDVDGRVDVYGLGVTLYELLTLRTPFLGGGEQELRRRIARGALDRMSSVNPGVPRDLAAVCHKAFDLDPARRYRGAGELAADLDRAARGRPVHARRPPPWVRAARLARRHPALSTGAVLALVVAVASVGFGLRERAVAQRILRLSDASLLRRLSVEADGFWPAGPERLPAIERWLASAADLLERRTDHERQRAALRARALPYTPAERQADRGPSVERLATLSLEIAGLAAFVDHGDPFGALPPPSPEAVRARWEGARRRIEEDVEAFVVELTAEIDALRERMRAQPALWTPDLLQFADFEAVIADERARLAQRATWTLADPVERWQREELDQLLDDLAAFEELVARVRRRRDDLAGFVRDASAWLRVREEVEASPLYGGLVLVPQVGLQPLGADAGSGLQEFLVIGSGREPAPTDAYPGARAFDGESGVVLVLVPGLRFRMGNRDGETPAPGVSVSAPLHEVELDPFLIAKTELTVGQTRRLGGIAPADLRPQLGDALPLTIDWRRGTALLALHGLDLPTEAQWELVARVGRDAPRDASLEGFANVCDRSWESVNVGRGEAPGSAFDDGYGGLAPAGSYRPSAWGIHDVFGNAAEWCRDWSIGRGYSTLPSRPGSGLKDTVLDGLVRAIRGGSYATRAEDCHCGRWGAFNPSTFSRTNGLRPVRALR